MTGHGRCGDAVRGRRGGAHLAGKSQVARLRNRMPSVPRCGLTASETGRNVQLALSAFKTFTLASRACVVLNLTFSPVQISLKL